MKSLLSFLLGCVVGSLLFAMHVDSELKEQSHKFAEEDKRMILEMRLNCALIDYKYDYKHLYGEYPPIDSVKSWIDTQSCIYRDLHKDSLLVLSLSYNLENEHVYVDSLITL